MRDSLRLYLCYARASVRGQMQYRGSFVMMLLGTMLGTGTDFIGIWAMFDRFGHIRGWTLPEVALFYGAISVGFALCELMVAGFDDFDSMVKAGEFDRLLLRPRSTALQLAGTEFQLRRFGSLAQGSAVLIWSACALHLAWTPAQLGLLLGSIVGCVCLFSGLFILQATLAFWTTESLEIANTLTYGGRETGEFPLEIYRPRFRRFFTIVVPLACVTYFPLTAVLGRTAADLPALWLRFLAPLAGPVFLLASLWIWQFGVRHYRSTGS